MLTLTAVRNPASRQSIPVAAPPMANVLTRTVCTAAHRTLPFGTKVRVTNKRNGKFVVVRINDRGPFIRGRVIDVTPAAARVLGFSGLTQVVLDIDG